MHMRTVIFYEVDDESIGYRKSSRSPIINNSDHWVLLITFWVPTMTRDAIRKVLSKVHNGYFRLQVIQRLYVNAGVIFMAFLVSSMVMSPQNSKGVLIIFLLFWVAAIGFDLITLYKKIYESTLGKGVLLILVSLCTNFALVLSSQLVNDIVGVDPSKFLHTTALLSILSIPIFIVAGLGIAYVALLIATPFFIMLHTLPDEKAKEVLIPGYSSNRAIPYPKITRTVQLVSFAIFCGFALSLSQKVERSYETFLTDTARTFLYQWEMYPKAPCSLPNGARIAFLSDEKLLVAEKNSQGVVFKVQECKSGT